MERTRIQEYVNAPLLVAEFLASGNRNAKAELFFDLHKKMLGASDSEAKAIYFSYFKS